MSPPRHSLFLALKASCPAPALPAREAKPSASIKCCGGVWRRTPGLLRVCMCACEGAALEEGLEPELWAADSRVWESRSEALHF